ncbi:MAG: DinB family protein [Phaeodactylibacter sp.]|nr:DinB family protein [Phaeodactylibacter sp.]
MVNLDYQFTILRTTRRNLLDLIDNYSLDQLNVIPDGFRNNLLWNAGHVLATQQLLTYGLTSQEFGIPQHFIDQFRKGTAPSAPYTSETLSFIKESLIQTVEVLESDYKNGIFEGEFQAYPTSYGVVLHDVVAAICFNNVHEGLHLGYCMALRKHL